MKTLLTILLLLSVISVKAQDGFWLGGSTGILMSKSADIKKGLQPASFSFSMLLTWRKNNLLIETTPAYCGSVLVHLNAGYSISISETVSLDLLAGLNYDMYTFNFNQVARIQWKDFFIQVNRVGSTSYIFSIGARCKGL